VLVIIQSSNFGLSESETVSSHCGGGATVRHLLEQYLPGAATKLKLIISIIISIIFLTLDHCWSVLNKLETPGQYQRSGN